MALAVSFGLLVARLLAPTEFAAEIAYIGAPALAVVALAARSFRSRGRGATPWLLLTLGVGCLLAAEVSWFAADLTDTEVFPAAGEYLNAAALLVVVFALWRTVIRVAPIGDRTGIIDSTAVALAAGTLGWLLVIEPAAANAELDADAQTWISILLALDVALLAVVTRLGFSLRVRPPAFLFIYLAAGGLVVLDGGESMLEASADIDLGLAGDLLMMSAYCCWALAAGRSDRLTRAPASTLRYVGARRIVVLGVSALVPLCASTVQHLRGVSPTDATTLVIGIAGVAIGALVMIRIAGLVTAVKEVADEQGRERFAALVEHSSDVIITVDREQVITYSSPAVEFIWGHRPGDLVGGSIRRLVTDPEGDGVVAQLQRTAALASHATLSFESTVQRPDGAPRAFEAVAANLIDHPGVGEIVVTMRDITDRKALEAELKDRAFRDSLTGLANRALFVDRVEHALSRRAERPNDDVVVLFIDLDDFKQVNDGLGHAAGDELLAAVGGRLSECVRGGDTVARLGGDEFAILLENRCGLDDAIHATERVLEVFALPLQAGNLELGIRASVGVAVAQQSETADDLIQHADIAMYEAKGSRSGAYQIFDPVMKTAAADRIALRSDLYRAVELKQFDLAYQPIVNLRSGRFTGAEALLRWHHGIRGQVSPADFVPIAEQTGLIAVIGQWVLERACRDAGEWQTASRSIGVSVNMSALQLHDGRLVERVSEALVNASLAPDLLTLEITETAMMADPAATATVLKQLRAMGVRVAIDDFGTGYCSLAYLKRFAVDSLKIDRSFVSEVKADSERLLAHDILRLADNLGVSTVAEGIEEQAQLLNLRSHGCDFGQGYHLGRPMDGEAWRRVIEKGGLPAAEEDDSSAPFEPSQDDLGDGIRSRLR